MWTILLVILFVLMCIYNLVYVLVKKPKTVGTIIITDEDYMYVELHDRDSMEKIKFSKYIILDVSHE